MKNRKFAKPLLIVLAMILVCVMSVFATLAYLTSTTQKVTNTFTVGNVTITLDEAKVDEYGVEDTQAARVMGNEYKLVANHTYVKDPTVYVGANSEDCYVRVIVTAKNVKAYADANSLDAAGFWTKFGFAVPTAWTYVADSAKAVGNDFFYEIRYNTAASAGETLADAFATFTTPKDLDEADLKALAENDFTIEAFAQAIQIDGFENDADAAFAALGTDISILTPAA